MGVNFKYILTCLISAVAGAVLIQLYIQSPVSFPTEPPALLQSVRQLAQLETVEFRSQKIIDLKDKQSQLWGLIEQEDVILLVASGVVRAGIDMSKITRNDIKMDKKKRFVSIRMPPPQLDTVYLDNEKTYVHTRKTDLLAKYQVNLETRARVEAEKIIKRAALESGILEIAKKNSIHILESLGHSLGYTHVEIYFP